MSAGRSNLQGALDVLLTLHLIEIDKIAAVTFEKRTAIQDERRDAFLAADEIPCLPEITDGDDIDTLNHRRLGGIRFRDDEEFPATCTSLQSDGQNAFHRAYHAIKAEFTDHAEAIGFEGLGAARADHGEGDGKIEGRAFFFQIRRGEVDGLDSEIQFKGGGDDGGGDSLGAFPHGGIRQADDYDARSLRAAGIDLHLNLEGIHTT